MSIDVATAKKVAKLARIRVSEEEAAEYAGEISTILNWVDMLGEVNTDDVPMLTSVSDVSLPRREDVVNDGGYAADVTVNAPKAEYDCFAVPKVIE